MHSPIDLVQADAYDLSDLSDLVGVPVLLLAYVARLVEQGRIIAE